MYRHINRILGRLQRFNYNNDNKSRLSTMTGVQILDKQLDVSNDILRPSATKSENCIRIRISAIGVNRADCLQRIGLYPPPKGASLLPGLEVSGIVDQIGSNVSKFAIGDKVMAILTGGYAEYTVVHEDSGILPIPKGMSFIEAAAVPEAFYTVWSNLFYSKSGGKLKPNESLLVHGGASGIGTTAIQLAKAFGSTVYTTVSTEEKQRTCYSLGADHVVNYRENSNWEDVFVNLTNEGKGIDVILDYIGGEYTNKNLRCLAVEGRMVIIGFMQGPKVTIDLSKIMLKRLQITGSTLRSRDNIFKTVIGNDIQRNVFPLLENGSLSPLIHCTLPLTKAREAHLMMEANEHMGKIVLLPSNNKH